MSRAYPRWDFLDFLESDERACLYLKAAAEDDTGNGDTIRLAWWDIQAAHDSGRVSINPSMNTDKIARILHEHGVGDEKARTIIGVLPICFPQGCMRWGGLV